MLKYSVRITRFFYYMLSLYHLSRFIIDGYFSLLLFSFVDIKIVLQTVSHDQTGIEVYFINVY